MTGAGRWVESDGTVRAGLEEWSAFGRAGYERMRVWNRIIKFWSWRWYAMATPLFGTSLHGTKTRLMGNIMERGVRT